MKDEMREDLLITRKDILLHISTRAADRSDEDNAAPCTHTRLLCRLFGKKD